MTTDLMDVSVVIPTRNRGHLLATTLRSVLRQRGVDVEVIVVDDASADQTAHVTREFDDARLQMLRHATPRGPNAARNTGARKARGEWLAFIDDDDLWAPDKLARQLGAAVDTGCDWAYAGSVNVNERLEVIHGVPPPTPAQAVAALSHYNAIPASASNVIVRRAAFVTAGGFNETLRVCEEWDLWIRLARGGPPACVPRPLVAYRMHAGNASLDASAIIEGARAIERLHGATVDWGRFHCWVAQLCMRRGRRGAALGQYARAALKGGGRHVRVDLAALARQALQRLGAPIPSRRGGGDAAWEDEARAWIEELRASDLEERDGRR